MDEKRAEELTDEALDAVSGGYNIGGVSIEDCPTITVSHLPGASESTLGRPPVEPGGQYTCRETTGGMQAQMDAKIADLLAESGSLAAVDCPIRAVDMGQEMTNFTKNNILQQQSQAMLAQKGQPRPRDLLG